MNFKAMSVFCKVVDHGVMAHAAEDLQLTPAAVSKIVGDLEESLGIRLLQRTTRRLQLTEAGMHYYEACVKILQDIEDVHQQFSQLSQEVKGRLKIAAPMSYGLTQLSKVIRDFNRLYPKVSISLHLEDATVNLIEEGYDIAIRIQREMKDSSLVASLFAEFSHHLVCSKSYRKEKGAIQTPDDLKDHRCLAYTHAKQRNRWVMTYRGRTYMHSFEPAVAVNNSLFLKDLMMQGQGLCLLPSFLIEKELKAESVVRVLPHYAFEPAKGWIVYPSRRFHPPAVTRFVEFFCKHNKIPQGAGDL
jgi:DNA-binding transcriptional LysR family regulator